MVVRRLLCLWVLCISSLFAFAEAGSSDFSTVLDRYVHLPDNHYGYELVDKTGSPEYTAYLLRMTSQQWRSQDEVNQSIWKHWMIIYVPRTVSYSTGMLYIGGGSTSEEHPKPDETLSAIATNTHSIVSELYNVPNEPLTFARDSFGPRTEDQIIAYTWRKFLSTGDSSWPLRLPMTKAAVRAMDTITSFASTKEAGSHQVNSFFVTGASKRGWTTWTTAAVDSRVVAIAPMVIDVLHVVPSFRHHYSSYGFWAPAVKSYFDESLMDDLNGKGFDSLMTIEDPYSYRDRFTMPKLLVNAAGDQFFLPDSSQFYFRDLPGEKHLLYEANADHSLRGSDASKSIAAFYLSILHGTKRPNLEWKFAEDGSIEVKTDVTPIQVKLWEATNPKHRDFRIEAIGQAYHSHPLQEERPGSYVARVWPPAKGWTAFFVEVTYKGEGGEPLKFTTAVRVLPDVEKYAFPEKGKSVMQTQSEAASY